MPRTATRVVLSVLLALLVLAGFLRSRRRPAVAALTGTVHPALPATETSVAQPERLIWGFGRSSTITDSLPRELDSLTEWGDYDVGTRPVAHSFDANGDGRPEFLVRSHSRMCGNGGCPMALLTQRGDGTFADVLGGLHSWLYVTSRRANGWPVLWVDDGGPGGGTFRLVYNGRDYAISDTLRGPFASEPGTTEGRREDSLLAAMHAATIR